MWESEGGGGTKWTKRAGETGHCLQKGQGVPSKGRGGSLTQYIF